MPRYSEIDRARNCDAPTGSPSETVARLDLESRVTRLEGSVDRAVGSLMPKVEALLSERSQGEGSASSSSTPTAAAPATSLLELAERGDGETLLQMLADGQVDLRINPPRKENGDTALHVAVSGGHLKAVMALLGAGALVDVPGHRLRTPLHCAAAHGHLAVAQRLLFAGAEVDKKNADGATALELATAKGYPEIVRLLLGEGARCNEKLVSSAVSQGKKVLIEFLQKGVSIDACNEEREPLLVEAAKAKRWEVVELLLERGASATKCKADNECALVIASNDGQADAVRHLLRRGAASNEQQVELALGNAKSAAVVWTILDILPNIVKNKCGSMGLVGTGCRGFLESMVALLEAGVDINSQNNINRTALHLASANGRIMCVRELLRRGANVNVRALDGNTPLHGASMYGHVECVRALLAAGASATVRNMQGKTPLEVAKTEVRLVFDEQYMLSNNLHLLIS